MKKLQFITLFVALLIFKQLSAQGISRHIDSLQEYLLKTIPDTTRVKALDELAYQYSRLDADKGLKFAKEAELLSLKINWKKGLAMAYSSFGSNYTAKCDYKQASFNYLRALDIFRETGNTTACGGILANMSVMYLNQSDYASAMEYSFNALKLLEDGTDLKTIAAVQENIGSIYLEQKDFAKTLHYFSLAYANNVKLNDKAAMARNMSNRGIVLNEKGEYTEALKCHEFALKTNLERGSKKSVQINLANIGNTYCYLKNYQKALAYHLKALEMSQELKDKKSIAINMGNAGEIYLLLFKNNANEQKAVTQLEHSIRFLSEAVLICRQINFKGPQAEFNQYLSEAYELNGNHLMALESYKEYTRTKDSIFTEETQLKIAALESKRSIDLKDKDITLKNQQIQISLLESINRKNETIIYLIGIALLLTIIFTMYVIFRIRSKVHRNILSEIATIQSHEVRAPLARILGLVSLFDHGNISNHNHRQLIDYLRVSALELDEVIQKIVNKASEYSVGEKRAKRRHIFQYLNTFPVPLTKTEP